MRPSLVPGLVAAAERNARRAQADVALFEVGQIFLGPGETDQRMAAAAVRRGLAKASEEGRHWRGGGPVDAFDAKHDAMALSPRSASRAAVQVVPGGPDFLHPGRSATLQFGPKTVVGWFGQLHPSVCEALDAEGPIVAFEIVLDAIPAPKARPTRAKPRLDRSDFMPVERDLAFVVDESVRAGDHPQGGAKRRARARFRHRGVRRLSGQGPAGGNEVDRDHGHAAAAGTDADRRRDRGGGRPDRRGGVQADRGDSPGLRTMRAALPLAVSRPSCRGSRAPRTIPPAHGSRSRSPITPASRATGRRPISDRRQPARSRTARADGAEPRTPSPKVRPRAKRLGALTARRTSSGAAAAFIWSSGSDRPATSATPRPAGMARAPRSLPRAVGGPARRRRSAPVPLREAPLGYYGRAVASAVSVA